MTSNTATSGKMGERKAAPNREKSPLPTKEYDFSQIPEKELKACCYYEYARESASVRKSVEYIRAELIASQKERRLPGWCGGSVFDTFDHRHFTLAHCHAFPKTPWRSLGRTATNQLNEGLSGIENSEDMVLIPIRGSVENTISSLEDLYLGPEAQIGIYYINTRHDQQQIISEFTKWLRRVYPKSKTDVKKGRGMSPGDSLNMLAALRLRKHCQTLSEAQELIKFYLGRTAWNRACKKAIKRFTSILGLGIGELPICYTEGWRK